MSPYTAMGADTAYSMVVTMARSDLGKITFFGIKCHNIFTESERVQVCATGIPDVTLIGNMQRKKRLVPKSDWDLD